MCMIAPSCGGTYHAEPPLVLVGITTNTLSVLFDVAHIVRIGTAQIDVKLFLSHEIPDPSEVV
jgi:hypothetical protein